MALPHLLDRFRRATDARLSLDQMRYRTSIPFVVGLLLIGTAFAIAPLFVTSGPVVVDGNPLTDSSWDIYQPTRWDFRIPLLMAVSGLVLMGIGVVRVHRKRTPAERE